MTLANKITISRILAIPIFIYLMFSQSLISYCTGIVLFTLLALTDSVDGYVARKYNQTSDFGKILDPLADKLLVISTLVGLVELQQISSWMVIIIIARELIVTSLRVMAANKKIVIGADYLGKIKTVLQIWAIILMLINRIFSFQIWIISISYLTMILTALAVFVTIWSGIEYIVRYHHLFTEN